MKILPRVIVLSAITLAAEGCATVTRQMPATTAEAGGTRADSLRGLDEFITRAADLGYSGIWLVQSEGRVLLDKGYGYADRERGNHFTPQSPFSLGSIPKQFTAAAILALQDDGRLSVSDSLARFFPGVPADKRAITIHHLLTHTAGLPTYSGPDDELITRDTLLARMMRVKLQSSPGQKFSYSNPGYSLLAAIVERVSGARYDSYVRDKLLAPLEMASTTSDLSTLRDELPRAYLGDRTMPLTAPAGSGRFPNGDLSWNIVGSAGFVSTTGDMLKWANAWSRGSILSDSARKAAVTRHVQWGDDTTRFYGYGWILDGPPGDRAEWHSGGDGANAAYLTRYVDRDITTISYTNHSQGPSRLVLSSVQAALRGSPLPELPAAKVKLDPAALQKFAGRYLLESGDTLSIEISNGQLVVPMTRDGAARATTCFPPLMDSSAVRDVDERVSNIFAGLSRGDLEPALSSIWSSGTSIEEEKEYWSATWPDWTSKYGPYRGVDLVGSRPGSSTLRPGVPLIDTYFIVRFERGQYLVAVKQDPDRKFYIDTSTSWLLQPRYYYVPQGDGKFETFNFMLQTRSPLDFSTNTSVHVEGMTIGCSNLRGTRL